MKAFIIDRTKPKTKTTEIMKHLRLHGHITSLEAFQLYGSQKVSSIIYNLRKKGWNIKTVDCVGKDRYGHTMKYADYRLEED